MTPELLKAYAAAMREAGVSRARVGLPDGGLLELALEPAQRPGLDAEQRINAPLTVLERKRAGYRDLMNRELSDAELADLPDLFS